MEVVLYNSNVCRLCGEENDNGTLLFSCEENNQNLSDLINAYLPIKVTDDGQLPRTICPGCTIQLEATVEFLNLIVNGQKILRQLHQREREYKKNLVPENPKEDVLITERIVYDMDHQMSLQMAGIDKPKKKRGRPPKKDKAKEEPVLDVTPLDEDKKNIEETNGKRRRKAPERFKEVIQGKELERIFKEEGVTDGDESDNESKHDIRPDIPPVFQKEPEVIGHMENSGELVVMVKGKGRGRPKGRLKVTREQCAICGAQFSCVGRYMSHVAQHGPVRYQCAECAAVFPTRLLFAEHQLDTKHNGQNILPSEHQKPEKVVASKAEEQEVDKFISEEDPVTMEAGTEKLPDLDALKVEPAEQPSKDADGDASNLEASITTDCIQAVQGGTDAPAAPAVADTSPEVAASTATAKGKVKLKCNYCDKMFSNKQSKSLHTKAVHCGERNHTCGECGARFPYPRSLALHKLSHRRRPPTRGYACDLCGKVLNHPSSVVYHKEAEHAGRRYVCGKCGKSFKHKQLLKRHQLVHSQLRPYSCKQCNSTFKTKANLLNHQLLHSGIKRFACDLCSHRFAHKTSLTLHMRWHTGQKPYPCNKCGKSFSQKGNLYEHERIHTGEKPYECSLCLRRFTTSSQHRLHLKRHSHDHQPKRYEVRTALLRRGLGCDLSAVAGVAANSDATVATTGDVAPTGEAAQASGDATKPVRHACGECGRGFGARAALRRHMRRHTGERPHKCPHCSKAFADASNLNKHKKQVHKQVSLLAGGAMEAIVGTQLGTVLTTPISTVVGATMGPPMGTVMGTVGTLVGAPVVVGAPLGVGGMVGMEAVGMAGMEAVGTGPVVEVGGESPASCEDRVIYVAYDMDDEHAFMQQEVDLEDNKIVSAFSSPVSTHHLPVTDEEGNPLHFTMEDGTQLAITLGDGKSLQIVTQDGHTIPVEINGYTESEEEIANTQALVQQLDVQKQEERAMQLGPFFTITNLNKL